MIETPLFQVAAKKPVRIRVLQPGGHPRAAVFALQGHYWRQDPGSPTSPVIGAQAGIGPADHWDFIPFHGAGGAFGVPGDYLYRNKVTFGVDAGQWGILRVTPAAQ